MQVSPPSIFLYPSLDTGCEGSKLIGHSLIVSFGEIACLEVAHLADA